MINPTPGRIVWYRGPDGETRAAIVTRVHGEFCLNLFVFGLDRMDCHCGMMEDVTHADPEQEPGCLQSWHWMPYQLDQAKKADDARQLAAAADREADDKRWRAGMLDMALRTPGLQGYRDVLAAAEEYAQHIDGRPPLATIQTKAYADGSTFTGIAPLPDTSPDGAPALPPHQQRVVEEHAELSTKIVKLEAFVGTELFRAIESGEQERLRAQLVPMETYRSILATRIEAFSLPV